MTAVNKKLAKYDDSGSDRGKKRILRLKIRAILNATGSNQSAENGATPLPIGTTGRPNDLQEKMLAANTLYTALRTTPALAKCGEVSITEMDWVSSAVVTSVAKFLLETGYGSTVNMVPSSTTPAMASIAETGEPDILAELWTNSSPVYAELRREE